MKAILCSQYCQPDDLVLADVPDPVAGPGEAVIAIKAAALNFFDILMIQGKYQIKPAFPFSPAAEIAGVVESVGAGVTDVKVGDRVAASIGHNGAREKVAVPASSIVKIPDNLDFDRAAGVIVIYGTALHALEDRADPKPGETLAVFGAAGGVGLAAVDLAKQLGAKVIAASASDEKLAILQAEYQPDAIVNVTGGFREKVKEITGGRGANVIYDPVGGDVFDESTRCIAFDGRLLVVGFASGRLPVLPVNMALIKGFSVMGVRAGEYGRQFPEKGRENQAAIWDLAAQMKPRVDHEYPLSDWRAAFDSLADRKVVGKTIVRPDL